MDPRFELIQSDADSSFRFLHESCPRFEADHAWHYHPEYELTWVIRSRGVRFVGDSIEPYEPGDLVLVGPDLPHRWRSDPTEDRRHQPEWIVVQFDGGLFGAQLMALPEAGPVRNLLRAAAAGLHFDGEAAAHAGQLLRAMTAQSGMSRLARLLEVLDGLGRAPAAPLASQDYLRDGGRSRLNRQRLAVVNAYVRENLDGAIRQAEIAGKLAMSPPAFSRFFRAATGTTFVSFVNLLRVGEACRRLADTSQSVTEIAMECGYRNLSNFNRQFLALKGMPPSDYRRKLRLRDDQAPEPLKAAS